MERQTNKENRCHQLKGFGRDYQNNHASLALAIVDALELLLERNNLVLVKKEEQDENVGIDSAK